MNTFTRSISQVFKGVGKSFQTFPAVIASALAFAVVTMIRIQLDWDQQEPYNFLFNCLHWAFALGAISGLAVITAAQSRFNQKKAFITANLITAGAAIITLLVLYFFGRSDSAFTGSRFDVVSNLAMARVSMIMVICFLIFIILAGYPKDQSDFARSFFMTHKAFFIALIYGSVIMSGASGVAGAVRALLYREMSSKVFMYIGTLTGFIAFTIFVGYFPDFRKGKVDGHREDAQKQPRFIEILFGYIMIPIVLALTLVLLLWAGRTILSGMGSSFVRLSSIATSYAIGGIWLHIMVTSYETGLAKFYRRVYPIAALVILAFEAWALVIQLGTSSLKLTEYIFALIWILAVAAAVLLLVYKEKAHLTIVILACGLAFISILPFAGYHALPVTAQVSRLEKALISQGILVDGELVPATVEPEESVRESITDAVNYLGYASDAKLPAWFDRDLRESGTFKDKLGFEQTWPKMENIYDSGGYYGTSLFLPSAAVNISDYDWAVSLRDEYVKELEYIKVEGKNGSYSINWSLAQDNIPSLKILMDDKVILEQDMNDYIDQIMEKYPPGESEYYEATADDMMLQLETPELTVLLVFSNIDVGVDTRGDYISYWLNLDEIFLKEK